MSHLAIFSYTVQPLLLPLLPNIINSHPQSSPTDLHRGALYLQAAIQPQTQTRALATILPASQQVQLPPLPHSAKSHFEIVSYSTLLLFQRVPAVESSLLSVLDPPLLPLALRQISSFVEFTTFDYKEASFLYRSARHHASYEVSLPPHFPRTQSSASESKLGAIISLLTLCYWTCL